MPDKQANLLQTILSLLISPTFFVAVIGGIIGAFLSPFGKWITYEKKKIQIENRKEKIRFWREEILNHKTMATFSNTVTYHELFDRIPKEKNNNPQNAVMMEIDIGYGSIRNQDTIMLSKFLKVVSEIEKEWGII
jgi:hypothetical protein